MPIEQVVEKIVEEAAKGERQKSMFEDSNRTSNLELPDSYAMEGEKLGEGEIYSDSDRDVPEGPQWDEAALDDVGGIDDAESAKKSELLEKNDSEDNGEISEDRDDVNDSEDNGEISKDRDDVNDSEESTEQKNDSGEKKELTDEQKQEIKEKTDWSDEIVDSVGSMEEAQIYMDAGLQEAEIDGTKCLIKSDIDMNQKDEDGISNRERMERGRPPLAKDGQEIELHHIGQKPDSPLAELTTQEHRGVGNDTILHDKNKESEIDRNEFAKERKSHWKSRGEGEI